MPLILLSRRLGFGSSLSVAHKSKCLLSGNRERGWKWRRLTTNNEYQPTLPSDPFRTDPFSQNNHPSISPFRFYSPSSMRNGRLPTSFPSGRIPRFSFVPHDRISERVRASANRPGSNRSIDELFNTRLEFLRPLRIFLGVLDRRIRLLFTLGF